MGVTINVATPARREVQIDASRISREGGASDVSDLSTDNLTPGNYLRVADPDGLEERTPTEVLSDIGGAASSHAHGNITAAGAIGSTSGLPLITIAGGVVSVGSFGTTAGTFCAGDDARLNQQYVPPDFGDAAFLDVGTTQGTVAAGDDARFGQGGYQEGDSPSFAAITASSTISQQNGGTAATFAPNTTYIHGFRADGSNYVRMALTCNTTVTGGTYVQVAAETAGTGEDNVDVILSPVGNGAFYVGPPADGTTVGGNARGDCSVDLQRVRWGANQVVSGQLSFCGGGVANTNNGYIGVCAGGWANQINGGNYHSIGGGEANEITAQAWGVVAGGGRNQVSAYLGGILGGYDGLADRYGQQSHATGKFAATGDCQRADFVLRCKTTTNTAVEMALDGSGTYLTIPSGKVVSGVLNVQGVKSDGSASAHYVWNFSIKNVGGTTSLVYAPVGHSFPAGTSLSVTANNTGDYLSIQVTGVLDEVWRWTGHVDAVETAYGT